MAPKMARRADWSITFDDMTDLRSVFEAAQAVMSRVIVKVGKVGDRHFLMLDGNDIGFTCCISARLHIANDALMGITDEETFCVECKHVLTAMDSPSCAHCSLVLEGHSQSATVHFKMRDPDQRSSEDTAEINTFVDATPPNTLIPMQYQLLLEMDLSKLKEIIKKAKKTHAEHLRVTVFLEDKRVERRSLVTLSARGDSFFSQKFCHETTVDEDGSVVVRAANAFGEAADIFDPDGTPAFDNRFPVEKIEGFVKNLPCRMIKAKAKQNLPLMFEYCLGTGESHIRFLVGPSTEEDDGHADM